MAHPAPPEMKNNAAGGAGDATAAPAPAVPPVTPAANEFEIVEYNTSTSNRSIVSNKISELREYEYDTLFRHTRNASMSEVVMHLVNFFEMCLLLNYARRGVLITLDHLSARDLKAFIEPNGYALYPFFKNLYFAISADPDEIEKTNMEIAHIVDTKNNIAIGKRLGYVTPFKLKEPQEKPLRRAELLLNVRHNEKNFTVQLVPQIIIDKSIAEIKSIYEKYVKVLIEVNKVLPDYISIENIKIRILPFKQAPPRASNASPLTTHKSENRGGGGGGSGGMFGGARSRKRRQTRRRQTRRRY